MKHIDFPQSICRFAVARADITPPVGIYHRMWGAASHDRSVGVHRPLTATVLLFQSLDESTTPATCQLLIALDHCLLGADEIDAFLDAVERSSGYDKRCVAISFSHTHAAGLMLSDRVPLPGGELIPEYLRFLNDTVAMLVVECRDNVRLATIGYAWGHCDLAAHRDYWDEDNAKFVCGFNPSQPADDTTIVARVTDDEGRILATIVNYACHPTTLAWDNRLISPDYPGAMREVVEQMTHAPCVFIQGACGELGPREGFVGDVAVADRNGRQLGYAALAALESLPPPGTRFQYAGPVESGATIGTWNHQPVTDEHREQLGSWEVRNVELPLRYRSDLPTVAEAGAARDEWRSKEEAARAAGDEFAARDCRAMVERRTRLIARLSMLPPGETFPYRVVAWRIGDAIWLSVQGEPYSLLQTELRRRFPDTPIIVASISHHWGPAYLPPAESYGKGIYQETIAVLEPGGLERLVDACSETINQLLHPPAACGEVR